MRWAVESRDAYVKIAKAYEESRARPLPVADLGLGGVRALDIGSGRGAQPRYINSEHPYVVHCDLDPALLPEGGDAALCEATALPFRPDAFDVAYAVAVYHHLPKDAAAAAVAEALRVARALVATVWVPPRWRGRAKAPGVYEVPWRWRGEAVRTYYAYDMPDLLELARGAEVLAAGYMKRGRHHNAFIAARRRGSAPV
ncbi:MAG: methyltransferase domain-containing protein [Thermoproteus sp. AZ2]|jgi:hypothetical protein|uniref:Methyltransferase domain-containing protein n=1 Tax=Thermoproteus sp. AZ2 TaxID=1609232 RepID=A0ACC6V2K8_9CREN|nr:MAG: methyltransferase type 11 [Thermoproteus sp. AZ2]